MISALLAVDGYGGMGYKGTLPWYVSEDLQV
jgi:dihydrofolate reductase